MATVLPGPYDVNAVGLTEKDMRRIQTDLAGRLRFAPANPKSFKTAAGVDLAYWKEEDGTERAVCCIVVTEIATGRVLEEEHSFGVIRVPYIPGLLAFRELPLVMETIRRLKTKPDLYVFDGNGYLHERHMGIACQAGFFLPVPTIGVAKTFYHYGEADYIMPDDEKGAFTQIVVDGTLCGITYRSRHGVKPIFISTGSRIDLDTALAVVKRMLSRDSRVPVPTRLADLETKKYRRLYLEEGGTVS